jgi:Protein of unknown function (DUF4231)
VESSTGRVPIDGEISVEHGKKRGEPVAGHARNGGKRVLASLRAHKLRIDPGVRAGKLRDQVDKLVDHYRREAEKHKRSALVLRIVSVVIAGLITVLLGLRWEDKTLPILASNVSLALSALITVLSAYEAFFDPRALWIRETVTFARLKDLQRDLGYWEAGVQLDEMTPDEATHFAEELGRFKDRTDTILNDTLRHWMRLKGAPDIDRGSRLAPPKAPAEPVAPEEAAEGAGDHESADA